MEKWIKLDNAAKIYPPVLSKHWASLYRLSVDLSEDVDVEVLEAAQKETLKRIPSFSCRLKSGLFWYYLEHIDGAPPIGEDIHNPLQRFSFKKNNDFLYRLLVYKNRIAIEVFHVLADGTGGLTFLLTLTSAYIQRKYGIDVPASKYVLNLNDEVDEEEYEDAFLKYGDNKLIPLKEETAYKIPGEPTDFYKLMMISGSVDTLELKNLAKKYDATISELAASLLLYAVIQVQKSDNKQKNKMAKVSVPVNLRRFFPSKTLRNFSSFVNPGVYAKLGDYDFREVLDNVKAFMKIYVNEKQLKAKFSYNVEAEKNPLIRVIPLFIKIPVLAFNYYFAGDVFYSTTISNLGQVDLPASMTPYVKRLDFLLGRALEARTMCACISYGGKTIFNFSRTLKNSDIERIFFSELVKMGVKVYIESNGRE